MMIELAVLDPPAWNDREILRYARILDPDVRSRELMEECKAEASPVLSYRVCYTVLDAVCENGAVSLGHIVCASRTLTEALRGADRAVIFAATVGAPFDLLIRRYSALSPAKAAVLQAIGAERAESLCDAFCEMFACSADRRLAPRVSPGYGDIPLSMQREIFALLDCPRKIGLTLNDSLLMSPSKSVTAIAGISDECIPPSRCAGCAKNDCAYRNEEH